MRDERDVEYEAIDTQRFTGPQRLDKQIHTLEGILVGIGIDSVVSDEEVKALIYWLDDNREYAKFHPFNEVIPMLREALQDGVIDEEERDDLLWLCKTLTTKERFYDQNTSDMQRLQGIIGGIAADDVITEEELRQLQIWMQEHEHLQSIWPYDEFDSIVADVLKDGIIDKDEHRHLLMFFNEFLSTTGGRAIDIPDSWEKLTIKGVCAMCPDILIPDNTFCFTGKSQRATRNEIAATIESLGGLFSKTLTKPVNYLIIGADGNECWAYSCYGRKVEQAVERRKQGDHLLIVHEFDFWDCVDDSR